MIRTNLTVLVLGLTFLSCGGGTGQSNTSGVHDSIGVTDKDQQQQTQPAIDSLTIIEQNKAIGEINFYISEKQFNKSKAAFIKKCKLPEYEFYKNATVFDNKIGGYGFNSIDGWFHNDSLYYIELRGGIIEYDDYDIVMFDQYDALMEVLRSKYGQPVMNNGLPRWSAIDKGYFKRCAIWNIGDKVVEARVVCNGTDYTLNLAVFKPVVEAVIIEEGKEKAKEETKKGADVL